MPCLVGYEKQAVNVRWILNLAMIDDSVSTNLAIEP